MPYGAGLAGAQPSLVNGREQKKFLLGRLMALLYSVVKQLPCPQYTVAYFYLAFPE